jgi:hypothetical protein
MQKRVSCSSAACPRPEAAPGFTVVIVYEDFGTGIDAKRACNFLAASFTHQWHVVRHMWKFELLGVDELREIAAQDAAMADLIIIACHREHDLPADVKKWVETWRAYQGEAVGLIGLFDGAPGGANHACVTQAYLKHIAKQSHLEFLAAQVRAQIS